MRTENKALNREAIINAASMVFGKYGYKKTTLEDITTYLNIGKTGIYYYFKNKEDIFREVIKKEAKCLHDTLIQQIDLADSPLNKFENYVHTRMTFLKRVGNYYSAIRLDLLEQLEFINETRKDFDDIEIQIIEKILEEGCENKFFVIDNLPETAQTIALTLKSLELPFFGTKNDFDYEPILKRLIKIMLNGILHPEIR